ncbi:hypothetical protein NC652_038275 [Populus alba x Populus x berolinensis]|nr:hypothetical protein NC652_038275 [Populus alba x Populus x berolinensis]
MPLIYCLSLSHSYTVSVLASLRPSLGFQNSCRLSHSSCGEDDGRIESVPCSLYSRIREKGKRIRSH